MPKLIDPRTGDTVRASAAGAELLRLRGYTDASGTTPAQPDPLDVWPDTHAGLDELAARAGFDWPTPPDGKKRLTVAEKIDALKSAGLTPA